MCFFLCLHLVQGSGFKVEVAAAPPFLLDDARKWYLSHQSLVTPTIRGKESSHMCGMRSFGSVPTCSGWGFSTHGAFSSAQDDDTRGRMGSYLGDMLRVLELAVLYYNTSRPLETEVPQRDFRVWPNPKRRLACPLRRLPVRPNGPRRRRRMDPRSGVKDYVRLPVFHLSSRPKWRDPSCRPVNRG